MTKEQHVEYKKHRDEFEKAFEDYEPQELVDILNNNPKNFRDKDENNPKKRIMNYIGCTKRILASYYASMQLGLNDDPFLTIEELKAKL